MSKQKEPVGSEEMTVGAMRVAGAVLGIIALGSSSGYAAGHFARPDLDAEVTAQPSITPSSPATPSMPVAVKSPKPNNTPALTARDLEFEAEEFTVEGHVTSKVAADVPQNWKETRPQDDEIRYTDPAGQRYIRIESGYNRTKSPAAAAYGRVLTLKESTKAENDLQVLSRKDDVMVNENGAKLDISTIGYTYIPELHRRYILVRWVALPRSDLAAVEIAVVGHPEDLPALRALLDRVTKTVARSD